MRRRGFGLRVIGAGFGRTGTSSLQAALEEIGFGPCYHMQELLGNPSHIDFWASAVERDGDVDWDSLMSGYGSAVDWPACTYYERLMEEYPDAKVILTVRDPERWHRSALDTIYAISNSRSSRFFFAVVGAFSPFTRKTSVTLQKLIWDGTFHGRFEDRDYATGIFEDHIAEVKRVVPEDRLLVYGVSEGWEPLCDFLGAGVPDSEFPHLNDTRTFRRLVMAQRAFAVAVPLLTAAATVAVLRRVARSGGS